MHMKKSTMIEPTSKVKVYPFTVYRYFYNGIIHLEEHPDELISNIFSKEDIESTINIAHFKKAAQLEILCVINYFCSMPELMLDKDTRNYRFKGLKTILSCMESDQLLSEFVSTRPFVKRELNHLAYLINNYFIRTEHELIIDPNKLGVVIQATSGNNKGNEKVLELIDLRQTGSIILKKEIEGFILYLKNNVLIERLTWNRYMVFIRGLSNYCIRYGILTINDLTALDKEYLENKYPNYVFNKLTRYISSIQKNNSLLNYDLWDISAIGWDQKQNNKSRIPQCFTFNNLENTKNKYLLKLYCYHLMEYTSYTLSTVKNKIGHIRNFLKYLKDIDMNDIKVEIINGYTGYRRNVGKSEDYLCHEFLSISEFIQFLQGENELKMDFDYKEILSFKPKTNYKITAVESYVIFQLFNILDKIDTEDSLIFLIIYSTGCRVSEACQLREDAISRINGIYSIKFITPKMVKEVINPIPKNLYYLLIEYRKNKNNQNFLFETKGNNPFDSCAYTQRMIRCCMKFSIKNTDGTPYKYSSHAFRHTMGKKMMDMDIAYEKIANVLHHESYEMTRSYIEYSTERRIRKIKDFYYEHDLPSTSDGYNEKIITAEYIRKMKNAQLLPNGICARLVKTGTCKEANRCLMCSEYRTSTNDLPVHKLQLKNTYDLLKMAQKNNWLRQVEKCNEMIKILQKIINQLEENKND